MAQYIDKNALVAELDRLKTIYNDDENIHHVAKYNILVDILSLINTLEVKELDFKGIKSVFEGQYNSKDKVVTTIEMLQDECEEQGDNNGTELLEKLFNKLDIFDVKEVDIEKEIKEDWLFSDKTEIDCLECMCLTEDVFVSLAKKFFELGLKAQKGE